MAEASAAAMDSMVVRMLTGSRHTASRDYIPERSVDSTMEALPMALHRAGVRASVVGPTVEAVATKVEASD